MKKSLVTRISLLLLLAALLGSATLTSCGVSLAGTTNETDTTAAETDSATDSADTDTTDTDQVTDPALETEPGEDTANTTGEASTDDSTTGDSTTNETEPDATSPSETDTTAGSSANDASQSITNNTITITGSASDIAYAAAKGLRSAVSIYCTFEVTTSGGSYWNPRPSTQTYYTTGSGVIYHLEADGSAFIVTNHHVVYESSSDSENHISEQIFIYLYGMESEAYAIPATYIGGSANYDLAVLRVEANDILQKAYASGAAAPVSVADSDALVPGQTTIAIGNPSADELGGLSVTSGIVSVDSEYITMTASDNSGEISFRVIRTDAPINSGNSGGGMYNDQGELIGIVNAKIISSDIENIGYALPSNVVRAIADNIIDYCFGTDCESVMRGLLGITIQVTGYSTAYDATTGLLVRSEEISVYEVTAGGLGADILQASDIVKSITIGERSIAVTRQHHLIDAMLDVRVGDTVTLLIVRDGQELAVSATITEDCLSAY